MSRNLRFFLTIVWSMMFGLYVGVPYATAQQPAIPELKAAVAAARSDSARVDALIALSEAYDFVLPDSALPLAKEARAIADRTCGPDRRSRAMHRTLRAYYVQGNYDEALPLSNALLEFDAAHGLEANRKHSLNTRGLLLNRMGLYKDATEVYTQLLEAHEAANDSFGIMVASINVGLVYDDLGEYDTAMERFRRGMRYAQGIGDQRGVALCYNNMGMIYRKRGQLDSSLAYHHHNLRIVRERGDIVAQARSYTNLGVVLGKLGRTDEAESWLQKSVQIADSLNLMISRMKSRYHLAEILILQRRFDAAERYALESLNLAKSGDYPTDLKWAHEILYRVFKAAGKTDAALLHHEQFKTMEDSLKSAHNLQMIRSLESRYETARTARVIADQEKALALQDNRTRSLVLAAALTIAVLVVGFLALMLVRKRRSARKEQAMRQAFSRQVLAAQETERKNIAADLHTGLGQHLLVTRNQLARNAPDGALALVDEAIRKVRTISRQMYPPVIRHLGLTGALEALMEEADQVSPIEFSEAIAPIDDCFDAATQIQVYRIVQECVSNIMRHSGATAARLEVEKHPTEVRISVIDNGKGFDPDTVEGGLGLETIRERIDLLQGSFKIQRLPTAGMAFRFHLPAHTHA